MLYLWIIDISAWGSHPITFNLRLNLIPEEASRRSSLLTSQSRLSQKSAQFERLPLIKEAACWKQTAESCHLLDIKHNWRKPKFVLFFYPAAHKADWQFPSRIQQLLLQQTQRSAQPCCTHSAGRCIPKQWWSFPGETAHKGLCCLWDLHACTFFSSW